MQRSEEFLRPCTPPDVAEMASRVTMNLLPEKSKKIYLKVYDDYKKWLLLKSASTSENVMLAYCHDSKIVDRPCLISRTLSPWGQIRLVPTPTGVGTSTKQYWTTVSTAISVPLTKIEHEIRRDIGRNLGSCQHPAGVNTSMPMHITSLPIFSNIDYLQTKRSDGKVN